MLAYGLYDWTILEHHIIVVSFLTVILQTNYGGIEVVYIYFLGEITNPLLHIKCSLKAFDQQNTKLYLLFEIPYLVGYCIFRLGFGVPFLITSTLSHKVSILSKAYLMCVGALSIYWAIDIIGVLNLRRKQFWLRKDQDASLPWTRPSKRDF